MDTRNRMRTLERLAVLCGTALALATGSAGPAAALITAALTPPTQSVTPGTDFDVFFDVTAGGAAFNGFDLVVQYDPAALTPVPLVPVSSQQGCLMTGVCSGACPNNTFHRFTTAGDSIVVSDVLLCNAFSLTGPGNLYRLRFHASNTPQTTQLTVRRAQFFNAGLLVTPVSVTGALIGIGVSVGVGHDLPNGPPVVRAEPNPARGRVQFVASGTVPGPAEAEIVDLQGRIVRALGTVTLASGAAFTWDGADLHGRRAPAGLYLVKLRRGGEVRTSRFILLQ
ncbi:MAG: T9SS type A sorting domain-containing protein [Candidatus Eisenbacteria bacterium]